MDTITEMRQGTGGFQALTRSSKIVVPLHQISHYSRPILRGLMLSTYTGGKPS